MTPPAVGSLTYQGRPLGWLSVRKYEAMIASSVFDAYDRFELIEGALVAKKTEGWAYSTGAVKSRDAIALSLHAGWHARAETSVRPPARGSMPEPDISMARGEADDYRGVDPWPGDVVLVVDVSDSTLAADRALAAIYVGGGIPTYWPWLLNVRDRQLKVHSAGGKAPAVLGESEVTALVLDGQAVDMIVVAHILLGM